MAVAPGLMRAARGQNQRGSAATQSQQQTVPVVESDERMFDTLELTTELNTRDIHAVR